MNTPSTSPRLHLLPVSLRTANAFVLSHHRHHRPVQGAKFALAVTLSDSDLIHGVAIVGRPVARAVAKPGAREVQAAVKRCVLGLVFLDAVLATAFVGLPGLLILLLLPPALLLGKWVYST